MSVRHKDLKVGDKVAITDKFDLWADAGLPEPGTIVKITGLPGRLVEIEPLPGRPFGRAWFDPIPTPTTAEEAPMTNTFEPNTETGLDPEARYLVSEDARWGTGERNSVEDFLIGVPVTIKRTVTDRDGDITIAVESGAWGYCRPKYLTKIEEEVEVPARPQIDFSGSSRSTARDYAQALLSRTLSGQAQHTLRVIAQGGKVDAYEANEAIFAAMRSVTTRFGQSTARRDYATMAAHLHHIVQAVLANHADGLPAYAEGERSRKVIELEETIQGLRNSLRDAEESLSEQVTVSTRSAARIADLEERLAKEVDTAARLRKALNAHAAEQVEHLRRTSQPATPTPSARVAGAEVERDAWADAFAYALGLLESPTRDRVLGYLDAMGLDLPKD